MFFVLLLFLTYINMVEITKIEDISICMNDTDCNESIDSIIHTQIPKIDESSSEDLSNETEGSNIFTTTIPTEISSRTKASTTEQSEVQSISTTISLPPLTTIFSPTIFSRNNKILKFQEKEICECDLTVRSNINFLI